MPIDAEKALAAEPRTSRISWDHKDVQLYHLGIGAGARPDLADPAVDPGELSYTLESRLQVLPSFATVAGAGTAMAGGLSAPGVDIDLAAVLHGGQSVRVHRPLPVKGSAVTTTKVAAVYDKVKAAVLVLRTEAADEDGPLWTNESEIFVRGEGGFGGERGPSGRGVHAAVAGDRVVERPVRPDQALLYRLSGDWNPLHADPGFAALAGFDRPILHGLCTYGMTLKAVTDTVLGGDATRIRSYRARFTGVVFPGETLRIEMWTGGGNEVRVEVRAAERNNAAVLSDTFVEYA
ncbi:MaoC/PaaZ C-terminal domain-containing protein [Streptomyces poriferorum]|uniref:MaoC/PaaZ C-terminal domain-containing protein n=1 Tax=Streptomyces poriferorum TaxID=2798799 RepID=A0ABY9J020_9ACTN|nr:MULTISPECIES: MaoC/PaaZ C-terminal domain-containing protein [Streptomyces]MBW5253617.1 MaoC family dehydratase N-terminal domain-containing protein [Streptomyces poriferorum]MBW5260710.1 MaoC family dehydratase N-terminal domain-containing protein [Streptomyces poriferorum]MDP5311634.1 MaoC/PaaZ C-terminal domain-containing protein [Streptomyces sp. Alt4]WLQ48033.1 MaoC/PaaZ C-terminal domain-containing protein [Streptomyces sp. Alt1]WLQ59281.1 MaoC/PaaZ C-terminal domain-containing protei